MENIAVSHNTHMHVISILVSWTAFLKVLPIRLIPYMVSCAPLPQLAVQLILEIWLP